MLQEARDRQKFFSEVQYLRDMQHKVDFEYQACLRQQESRRDPNEKKRNQFWDQETGSQKYLLSSKTSSKQQSSGEEESLPEPRPSARKSGVKCNSKLPAVDPAPVKQKRKYHDSAEARARGPQQTCSGSTKDFYQGRETKPGETDSPEMLGSRASEDRSTQKGSHQ